MRDPQAAFLTIVEFSLELKVHSNTIRKLIRSGKIFAINIGSDKKKLYRIPSSEIQRLAISDLREMLKIIKIDDNA